MWGARDRLVVMAKKRAQSLPSRIRTALSTVFNRGRFDVKGFQYGWPTWIEGRPQWQIVNYEGYTREGFNENVLVYNPIMYKARAIQAAPLRAYTGDFDHPDPAPMDHPLAQLCARPNPHMMWPMFAAIAEVYFNISGNIFIRVERTPGKDPAPSALWLLRPDMVQIVPLKNNQVGYQYRRPGQAESDAQPIAAEDMIHIKLPNPLDPLDGLGWGLSPISPIAKHIDVDNAFTSFLKIFAQAGGFPPIFLEYPEGIDQDTKADLRQQFQDQHGGPEGWIRIGILDKGAKANVVGYKFSELGFEVNDRRSETRILGPFGVPPVLTGTSAGLDASTYANYATARTIFWEDTMLPELELWQAQLAYHLNWRNAFVKFDKSNVPALKKDVATLVTAAYQMWQMGAPADVAYETVGLDVSPYPGSDRGYLPFSVSPVSNGPRPNPLLPSGDTVPVDVTPADENPQGDDQPQATEDTPPKKKALD